MRALTICIVLITGPEFLSLSIDRLLLDIGLDHLWLWFAVIRRCSYAHLRTQRLIHSNSTGVCSLVAQTAVDVAKPVFLRLRAHLLCGNQIQKGFWRLDLLRRLLSTFLWQVRGQIRTVIRPVWTWVRRVEPYLGVWHHSLALGGRSLVYCLQRSPWRSDWTDNCVCLGIFISCFLHEFSLKCLVLLANFHVDLNLCFLLLYFTKKCSDFTLRHLQIRKLL